MFSVAATQTEPFLHHQMNDHQMEAPLKCWNRYHLKYYLPYFEIC